MLEDVSFGYLESSSFRLVCFPSFPSPPSLITEDGSIDLQAFLALMRYYAFCFRYLPVPSVSNTTEIRGASDVLLDPPGTNTFSNFIESDHDSAPSPPDMSVEKSSVDARALVAIPAMNVEALSVVPMRKSKRSEAAQRRIRRPFSVSEVEALLQAVEKLGTGRCVL